MRGALHCYDTILNSKSTAFGKVFELFLLLRKFFLPESMTT